LGRLGGFGKILKPVSSVIDVQRPSFPPCFEMSVPQWPIKEIMNHRSRQRHFTVIFTIGALLVTSLQAATITWNGAANGNWSGANWSGGTPVSMGSDTLIFQGSNHLATTNDLTGYTASGATAIAFNSGAGAFTLSGNAIALEGNITNSSTSLQTINLGLSTAAIRTVTTSASGGDIAMGGVIGGTGGISKAGTGALTLSGSNSYSGGTTLSGGILNVADDAALGSGGLSFGSLGTIQAVNKSIAVANSGTFTTLTVSGTQNLSFTGRLSGFTGGSRTISNNISAGKILTLTDINISDQASTRSVTINGTGNTVIAGTIANGNATNGQFTNSSTGLTLLTGTNTYTNLTTVTAGTLQFGKTASLYNSNTANWIAGRLAVASGATLAFNVGGTGEFTTGNVTTLLTNLATSTAANNGMNAGSALGFDTSNASASLFTIGDVVADTTGPAGGSRGLTKLGSGTLALSAVNTYSGTTIVGAGTLLVSGSGSINSTSRINVAGSSSALRYNSTVGLDRNVAVSGGGSFSYSSAANYSGVLSLSSGKLGGTNWNGGLGGLTIGAGQSISPGNSPGTASTTTQTWASLGAYIWEINQAAGGTAGSDPGWDLLTLSGDLTITATTGGRFTINIVSLALDNTAGNAAGFNAALTYHWLMADSANAIQGFDASKFALNTADFTNSFDGTFGISLGDTGGIGGDNTQIYLTYTAVPEPSTVALLGLGVFGTLVWRCRRSIR